MKNISLVEIALETLKIVESGFYRNSLGKEVSIKELTDFAVNNSESISPEYFPPKLDLKRINSETKIEVTGETTLEAAKRVYQKNKGTIPFALNFANGFTPGGGFLVGAVAQEESLARASSLYPCLTANMDMYEFNQRQRTQLASDWMIYSPQVPVFRNDDASFIDEPYYVTFLTSPAVCVRGLTQAELENVDLIYSINRERIRKFLWLANKKGHQTLILGAWGCGAFRNNVQDIAETFRDLLKGEFANCFERVIFAIYDTTPTQQVYKTFVEVLGN
ncbi:MAG TPA: TIGR02452 family protein [Pyrinomonadaceae bacterium]|nr:TIGR02452 family protein [Pyrinomonadaceae bacterium]